MKKVKERIFDNMLKFKDSLYPIGAALGLVFLWHGFVYLLSIPTYLLPSPYVVIHLIFLKFSFLFEHALVTLYEMFFGFVLAIVIGIPVSVVLVWWKPFEKTVMPLMVFLQTVPKVAIAPLFIIWFGFGYFPKVLMGFLLAYFPIVIVMNTGLRDVPFEVLDLAKSMSASPLQSFIKIRIPNSLPYLFNGLKLGILLSLTGAITGEFMGSMKGLGYLIMYANARMDTKLLFAVLVILLFLGNAGFSLVEWIERYAISWHVVSREKEKVLFAT